MPGMKPGMTTPDATPSSDSHLAMLATFSRNKAASGER
jgi:hypothetical protein